MERCALAHAGRPKLYQILPLHHYARSLGHVPGDRPPAPRADGGGPGVASVPLGAGQGYRLGEWPVVIDDRDGA